MLSNTRLGIIHDSVTLEAEIGSLAATSPETQKALTMAYLDTRQFLSDHHLTENSRNDDLPKGTIASWEKTRTGLIDRLYRIVDEAGPEHKVFKRKLGQIRESTQKGMSMLEALRRDLIAAETEYRAAKKKDPTAKERDYKFKLPFQREKGSEYDFSYPTSIYYKELESIIKKQPLNVEGRNRALAQALEAMDTKMRADIAEIWAASKLQDW
ncbi:MAG: hypothetical protein R3A80_03255 [Bdellovibrionota bacterium]